MKKLSRYVDDFAIKVLKVRKYKAGYEVRTEEHTPLDEKGKKHGDTIVMQIAYTPKGHYIGDSKQGKKLVRDKGIKPELANPDDNVCSIGFCEEEQKWYGWSHRAIYGFEIGDTVEEGDCVASSGFTDEYLAEHPEEDVRLPIGFVAETLDDAKRMARAFAESVAHLSGVYRIVRGKWDPIIERKASHILGKRLSRR